MSIDKKSWIKIIGMFLLFSAILIIDAVYVKNREGGQLISAYSGFYLYYAMQDLTLYLVYFIGICILANELYAIDCFKMHKNKFDHMIIQRKGYVSAQRMMIMKNTCISGAVFLLAHIVLLLFIHCFLQPLYAEGMLVSENMCLLASDVTLNLMLYLVLSTAGMILFSDLILMLRFVIKNIYVYAVTGIIIGLALYLIPPFAANALGIGKQALMIPFIANILLPGLETYLVGQADPLVMYGLAFLFYLIVLVIGGKFVMNRGHQYGW